MQRAILKFGRKLRKQGGVGLFYYAGHGIQHEGKNYLLPVRKYSCSKKASADSPSCKTITLVAPTY
jgi:uncharacterized caspase-like protein